MSAESDTAARKPSGPSPAVAWGAVAVIVVLCTLVVASTAPDGTLGMGAALGVFLAVAVILTWSIIEAWIGAGVQLGQWTAPSDWTPEDEAYHRRVEAEAAGPARYRAGKRAQVPIVACIDGVWAFAALAVYDAADSPLWILAEIWTVIWLALIITTALFAWPWQLLVAADRRPRGPSSSGP